MKKEEILKYIDNNFYTKTKNRICIKTENIPALILNELTSFNKNFNKINLGQITYNYINNISEVPLCPICNKPRSFYNIKQGYRLSCGSNSCSSTIATSKMLQSRKDNIVINESTKTLDITKEHLKVWIKENLYRKDKVIDGNKTDYRKLFYNNHKEYFNTIIKYTNFLKNVTMFERINIILNDLTKEDYKHLFIQVKDKETLLEWIKANLFDKDNNLDGNKTERSEGYKEANKDKFDLLEQYTSFLDKDCKTSERIYCLINNITSKVKCNNPDCNNSVHFKGFNKAYRKYCCWKCSRIVETYNLLKETCIEKYGVDNAFKSDEVKKKIEETTFKNHGVRNYTQLGTNLGGYKWKEYILPSNKKIKIQGFENYLFDELLQEYNEDDLVYIRKEMPEFWYIDNNNKKRRYFPDLYIPKTNTIYEVKSSYTYELSLKNNIINLKKQSVLDKGYNFILKIY